MKGLIYGVMAGGVCMIVQQTPGYDSLTWFAGLGTGMAILLFTGGSR